jgi:hypothetical protein
MIASVPLEAAALVNENEASRFLSISTRTLQAWRLKGVGPPFVRLGRAVRYQRCALVEWTNANTVIHASGGRHPSDGVRRCFGTTRVI